MTRKAAVTANIPNYVLPVRGRVRVRVMTAPAMVPVEATGSLIHSTVRVHQPTRVPELPAMVTAPVRSPEPVQNTAPVLMDTPAPLVRKFPNQRALSVWVVPVVWLWWMATVADGAKRTKPAVKEPFRRMTAASTMSLTTSSALPLQRVRRSLPAATALLARVVVGVPIRVPVQMVPTTVRTLPITRAIGFGCPVHVRLIRVPARRVRVTENVWVTPQHVPVPMTSPVLTVRPLLLAVMRAPV